ncbi:hypothetical protein TNCV_3488571 [Trichonephila clavipes]|nr:hypothetical protein TNCV_3488571 [Trichonephila clavipes]
MFRVLVAYFSPWSRTSTRGASATPNAVTLSESLNIALFMEKVPYPPGGWTSTCWSTEGILFPFYHPLETNGAFPYPPPGDAPSRGYRLPPRVTFIGLRCLPREKRLVF